MEQGDTPESRSTAFHYQHVTPGAPSVGGGAQRAAAHVPAAQPRAAAEQLRGGVAAGNAQQQPQQQEQQQHAGAGGAFQLPATFLQARTRMQAVQAGGPLPTWTGTGTTGTASHHNIEGTALRLLSGKSRPFTFSAKLETGKGLSAATMLVSQGDFSQQSFVLGDFVTSILEQLIRSRQLSGQAPVYLCLHLLTCYRSRTLPAALLRRWEQAGVVARGSGGGWVPVLDSSERYPLIIKVQPNGSWQLSRLKFFTKHYSNAWLRQGLGLLGLRLREDGDADGAVVCSTGDWQYVYTPFGASLWRDSMQAVFSSLEAAHGLEVEWTAQKPEEAQGEHDAEEQAPDGWQLSRLEIGERVQKGA